ncbi:hypothetical protein ACFYZH_09990 [Streptomyces abikoensis]|uniref:hypothetical protein n=1 Tax=Streptomyces abikoensis TaxID=97398 RepID=UPI003695C3A7
MIEPWTQREVVSARKLNARIRDPLRYLADMPRLACRGAVPGQSVTRGQLTHLKWAFADLNGFRADAARTWYTVPDTGVYVLHASVTVRAGTTQAAGDGVIINLYQRASNGTLTNLAMAREIAQQSGDYEIVSTTTVVHLVAGDAIGTGVYLEAGTPPTTYTIQPGEWETVFSAWMVAPGASTFAGKTTPFVAADDWADRELVTPAHMTARITQPLQALLNAPRVSIRAPLPYSAASNQLTRVRWSASALEESGGWTLSSDGSALTAPAPGVYLLAFSIATRRDGPEGAFGSYQTNLVRNGELVALHQRQNTRSGYPTAISGTQLLYLRKGDTVSTDFIGTGTGLTWRDFGRDITDERWNHFTAVMLAPGATSMKG